MSVSKVQDCHRAWLVIVTTLLLSSRLYAQGQEAQARLNLGKTFVDTAIGISVEDLQAGVSILNTLREQREQFCENEKTHNHRSSDDTMAGYCGWHHAVPTQLRKELPRSGYDEITDVYSPPYPPYNLNRLQSGLAMQSFVPIGSVKGGSDSLKRWNVLADTGELFNCHDPAEIPNDPANRLPDDVAGRDSGSSGFRVVAWLRSDQQRAASSTQACLALVRNPPKQRLSFLSVCEILNLNGISGAPERCFPIAASSHSNQWILAGTATYYVLLADNGRPDFAVNLFGYKGNRAAELDTGPSLEVEDVLKAAETAMSHSPLLLTTKIKSNVLGVAAQRTSTVLGDRWNEQVTVRVDVSDTPVTAGGKVTEHNFELEVSTSILVNEQKDPNPTHWHAPNPGQAEAWNEAIRQRLTQEISHLCPQPGRKDDFTVICKSP